MYFSNFLRENSNEETKNLDILIKKKKTITALVGQSYGHLKSEEEILMLENWPSLEELVELGRDIGEDFCRNLGGMVKSHGMYANVACGKRWAPLPRARRRYKSKR